MGDRVMVALGLVLICCMTYSNGEIALKTQKNELPKERRKIVKLLLRNFPLQESASYHNLVEDDEAGQPIHRGSSMTKYAPSYPYKEESMSELRIPSTKLKRPDISKFEYALSTILLPPPMSPETLVNSEDNADVYYAPYMQYMYKDPSYLPDNSEDNADVYYAPYMQNDNEKQNDASSDPEEEFADEYYIPYMKYDQPDGESYYLPYHQYQQQQQDQWLKYFYRQPLPVVQEEYQELPVHDAESQYEGPAEEVPEFEDESLPGLGIGMQYTGPATNDNEIFDMPRVFLKIDQ